MKWLNDCQVKWLLATVLTHVWKVEDDHVATYDSEVLNRINASDIPPNRLALKPDACIILIKNLNISHGHCNGTRNIIMEMTPRVIKAEKLSANA